MAYSKVILNGQTLMDVTQKTVTAETLLQGETALKNDGTSITGTYEGGGGGGYEDVSSQYTSSYVNNVYCVLLDRQNKKVIFSAQINTNNPEAMMGNVPVPLYWGFGEILSIVKCYYQANSTIYNDAQIAGDPYLPSASFKSVCTVYCEAIVAGGGQIF